MAATPAAIDRLIYFVAPAIALFPSFALGGTMPWGPNLAWTPIADVNIGVLFILAVSSFGVYGIVLAGYSSNNKYSLLGGLRSSAQLISYELAMGISLASVVLATGSLKMTDIVRAQEGPFYGAVGPLQNWFIFTPWGFLSAIIFAVCIVAETNRPPFDLPEAENELVAGYHTEYSSMKFGFYYLGEYTHMLVVSCLAVTLFFGGWHGPFLPAVIWFFIKVFFFIFFFIWVRATYPRLREDQLQRFSWLALIPLALAQILVVGFVKVAVK